MAVQRAMGIDQGNISKCASGKLKSAGGYIWKYAEESELNNESIRVSNLQLG